MMTIKAGGKHQLRVTLRGGLGNQLFSYALGLELSRRYGKELVMDTSLLPSYQDSLRGVSRFPPELQNFAHEGVVLMRNTQPLGRTNVRSKLVTVLSNFGVKAPGLASRFGIVVAANLETFRRDSSQNPRWLPDLILSAESALKFRRDIQSQVRELKRPSVEYLSLTDQIHQAAPIAVHLREGDYKNMRHLYGPSSPPEYLFSALRHIDQPATSEVWIFSDSPTASEFKEFGGLQARSITPQSLSSPLETLLLMSQARGLIGANSTFSWWASFLAREGYRATFPYYKDARHNIGSLVAPNPETVIVKTQGN